MILELHIIQNFAPSNLNRDDTNAPKDCEFGGYRRARISSQCIKRTVRRHPAFSKAVKDAGGDLGVRTKRLKNRLVEIFTSEPHPKVHEEAQKAAGALIELLGLKLKDEEKTEYLLYFGEKEIEDLGRIGAAVWGELQKNSQGKDKDKKKKSAVTDELKKIQADIAAVVSRGRTEAKSYAADIALFGRMIADNKNMNVDAACQVAHAISTHKVEMEMDYFTAVDDLLPGEDSGSDMIGVVEFNSSCFYRYSLLDVDKLRHNLGPMNADLLKATVRGYLEASIKAVPTGKQNSMAAQNPAGYVRVLLRNDGFPWSLANAFQKPITPDREKSLEERSIDSLSEYYKSLARVYGTDSVVCDASFNLYDTTGPTLNEVLGQVTSALG